MSLPAPHPDATVLVTGASSGIGAELARQLSARGHNVTLVARRADRLADLAEELRRLHGVRADVHACDLSDAAARTGLIEALRGGPLRVDAVCNNAGYGTAGRFHELPLERESQEVQLNVAALHELSGAFLPEMVARGAGAILNVGSVAAFQPLPGFATYAATKAFVVSFSEALSADLAGTGVSCTVLCPGPVHTEFGQVAGFGDATGRLPSIALVSPADVAAAAIDGMAQGRRSVIPGLANRVTAAGGRFVPRSVLLPLAARFGAARIAEATKR